MYSDTTPNSPWCPFCGYSENELKDKSIKEENKKDEVEEIETTKEFIVKKEQQRWSEDRMTEKMCSDGGWWNPLTKQCMGEGNGFMKEEE